MGNRWANSGNRVRLYFLGSIITADGDCSQEMKRHLLLGRKVMTNLDSILKSRDITLPTKVHLVKAIVFPVVMYGCESWTVKKAEHRRINVFELWCWRRFLRVPWTASGEPKLLHLVKELHFVKFRAKRLRLWILPNLAPLPTSQSALRLNLLTLHSGTCDLPSK